MYILHSLHSILYITTRTPYLTSPHRCNILLPSIYDPLILFRFLFPHLTYPFYLPYHPNLADEKIIHATFPLRLLFS